MKKIVLSTIVAAAAAMSLSAASTAACASCHGATFEKAALGASQIVKGWDAAKIETALKGYKDGSYGGAKKAIMLGQVSKLTDADITDLAKQIAAMK
jgi:cytochrome c553